MTQYKEPVITRTEDIVVRSTTKNTDNYLIVTDEQGDEHKISPKRDRLFPVFQVGAAVHLSYASFKGKDYIQNATPLEQMIKIVKPPESGGVNVKIPEKGKMIPNEGKNRSFALAYAKDLAVAGKIEVSEVISMATVYDMYLSGEFSESESEIITKYLTKYKKGVK